MEIGGPRAEGATAPHPAELGPSPPCPLGPCWFLFSRQLSGAGSGLPYPVGSPEAEVASQ